MTGLSAGTVGERTKEGKHYETEHIADGTAALGMSDDDWLRYCRNTGEYDRKD